MIAMCLFVVGVLLAGVGVFVVWCDRNDEFWG